MGGKRIRYVDFEKIESDHGELCAIELEIQDVLPAPSPWLELFVRLDLEEALKTLTPNQRLIWVLFSEEGYTLREISKICGKHFTTVFETLSLANRRIQKFFSEF